ncbi:phage major capsid protein [Cytobacillus sp. Hz8]|uniref:phage major capsid protein n=1 Tax=Cytobacillus sp. Hz8 TaxID=3347168 RepID=UPI0035E21443
MDKNVELKKRELLYKLKLNRAMEADGIMLNETNRRIELRNLLQIQEVREFYNNLQLSLRANQIIGGSLAVPEMVQDRIRGLLSKYSGLYDEVQVVPVGTDGRVLVSVGEAKAKWESVTTTLEELQSSIDLMEMHDIRLGGYIPVSNGTIEDSLIDMVIYLEELLAKAVAYGIDDGIINGVGDHESIFEPTGLLMNLPPENIVTIPFTLTDILSQISLIDTGKKDDIGEVAAVMKRKTYYKDIMALANSSLPYPNINGLRVKFSGAVSDDTLILGDFKEYILAERNGLRIQQSEHQFFTDDLTVFKAVGRYDGQPHIQRAFVKIVKGA